MEREKQTRESTGLEGEAERAKERSTRRWVCAESCRERDVLGSKGSEGAESRPAVWGWPHCGGRIIQTRYSNPRCLPQVVPRLEMSNNKDALTVKYQCQAQNGDNHHTASSSSLSSSCLIDFEIKECKKEPDSSWANDDLSQLDTSSTNLQRIPVPALTVKSPIVLLERCDKIWETLQLIRVQSTDSTIESKDEKKKEKKDNQELPLWNTILPLKTQRRLTADIKKPFHFSVQKTRKLFPCVTCGKQYLEKRSLRKHALRIHGIIIPVRYRRKSRISETQNSCVGSSNFDKANNNKYSCEKTTAGRSETTKLSSIFTHSKRTQNTPDVDSSNDQSENTDTEPLISSKTQYNKCALCRQKVKSVKKHLINYHKIGCSASMLKQLETSLLIDSRSSSGSSKLTLKDILSGKPPGVSINKVVQNKSHRACDEDRTRETSQVAPQKRKYTLSYMDVKKRFKLNNGSCVPVQKTSMIAQKHASVVKNKCDICLGVYSNPNSLAKHKRIHLSRGETKENFHNFVCKYFNSPLSKRYQQTMPSVKSAVENGNKDSNENLRSSNPKILNQEQRVGRAATIHDAKNTTCLCGRSFRNYHVFRIHKDNCRSCKQESKMAQHSARDEYSSDRDSGIGINITIKKRNNSYEIVGKDSDEDKQADDVTDDTPPFDVSHDNTKDAINADAGQKLPNKGSASKYSKNHSFLKLQNADEDLIINVEEDVHLISKQKRKQTVDQANVQNCSQTRRVNDVAEAKEDKWKTVRSLRQICQEVLKKFEMLQKIEDTPTQPQEKTNLRSVNVDQTGNETTEKEHLKSQVPAVNFDLTTCAYCNKHFGTISLCNKHQCTVEEGRRFEEYSLNLLCFSCNTTLNNCMQFDKHMKSKHHVRTSYYCYLCPKKFWNKKARTKHINTQHDTSCRFCHVKFPLWIISLHESYHLGFGYPCHKCKKAYSTKKNLIYHNTTIHKIDTKAYNFCNVCLQTIKIQKFRRHMQSHNGKKCHFCNEKFNDKAAIEYHTLIYHGGAFCKIKCNDCGMRYLTKKQLELHRNTVECDRIKRIKEENML